MDRSSGAENRLGRWTKGIHRRIAQSNQCVEGLWSRILDTQQPVTYSPFCRLQQIKDEIDGQSRPVSSCLEQVRQLVLTGGDVLSAPEVSSLESSGRELRSRVDRAQDRVSKLLKKLGGARDELSKLR